MDAASGGQHRVCWARAACRLGTCRPPVPVSRSVGRSPADSVPLGNLTRTHPGSRELGLSPERNRVPGRSLLSRGVSQVQACLVTGRGAGHTHTVTRVVDWPQRGRPDPWGDRGLEIGQRLSHACHEATAHTGRLQLSPAPQAGIPSAGRGVTCPEDRAVLLWMRGRSHPVLCACLSWKGRDASVCFHEPVIVGTVLP